eukprot:scaffold7258_cov122-Isochrysis_galbana.AAC.1
MAGRLLELQALVRNRTDALQNCAVSGRQLSLLRSLWAWRWRCRWKPAAWAAASDRLCVAARRLAALLESLSREDARRLVRLWRLAAFALWPNRPPAIAAGRARYPLGGAQRGREDWPSGSQRRANLRPGGASHPPASSAPPPGYVAAGVGSLHRLAVRSAVRVALFCQMKRLAQALSDWRLTVTALRMAGSMAQAADAQDRAAESAMADLRIEAAARVAAADERADDAEAVLIGAAVAAGEGRRADILALLRARQAARDGLAGAPNRAEARVVAELRRQLGAAVATRFCLLITRRRLCGAIGHWVRWVA